MLSKCVYRCTCTWVHFVVTNVGLQFVTHLCLLKKFEFIFILTYKTLTILVQAKLFYIIILNVALPQAYAPFNLLLRNRVGSCFNLN